MHNNLEHRLRQQLLTDPIYQKLLTDCASAESDYLRIRDSLSPDDRVILESYLALCEETDHRKLYLLLEIASPSFSPYTP